MIGQTISHYRITGQLGSGGWELFTKRKTSIWDAGLR